ncbi:MAG: DUF4342 domain-containing protein [Dehalococcoidia bacterium]
MNADMYDTGRPSRRRQVRRRVERAVHEGNRRSVIVRRRGNKLFELPLTIAIIAAVVAPPLVLVGVLAVAFWDTTVEMRQSDDDRDSGTTAW